MIPLIDLHRQYITIKKKVDGAIQETLNHAQFVLGPEVTSFEAEFASYCQSKYCVTTNSGTDALLLCLKSLNIGPGDEVIAPTFTFISTVLPIIHLGARPVLADVSRITFTIDPQAIAKLITPRTKAIIPVHLYGHPANLAPIFALAKKHGISVIDDACQAHGALYQSRPVGSLCTVSFFSFYPSKNLGAYGDGGAVTTNSFRLAQKIRSLANVGRSNHTTHRLIGINSRLDNIQAAVLRTKLPHLNHWIKRRREIAKFYLASIKNPKISLPREEDWAASSYHIFAIRTLHKNQLISHLKKNGIGYGIHYSLPLHLLPALKYLKYRRGDFPISESLSRQVISIPIFPELTKSEINTIVQSLNTFEPTRSKKPRPPQPLHSQTKVMRLRQKSKMDHLSRKRTLYLP